MLEDRHRLGALRFAALAVTMAAVALCVMTKKAARADGQTARSPVPPVDAINLADVIRLREKLAHRAVHVVQGVKSDASELSAEEMEAVSALGALRAEEGCEALVAIVTIRGPAPATQVFVSPDGGLARLTRSVLDDSPAGLALAEIGLPALRAIQRDMEDPTRPKPSDLRLRIYGQVFWRVLGSDHVRAYVMEEKRHAPPEAGAIYDRLLALPAMNPVRGEWRRGSPTTQPRGKGDK